MCRLMSDNTLAMPIRRGALTATSRVMTKGKANDYAAEKLRPLRHLAMMQRIKGWKTSDRGRDLRAHW